MQAAGAVARIGRALVVRAQLVGRSWIAVVSLAIACTEPDPPATKLAFIVQPPLVNVRGQPMSPVIAVEALSADGRRASKWTGNVTIALDTVTASLIGPRSAQALAGVATFTNLGVSVPGTGFWFTARAQGMVSAISNQFEVRSGPASRLTFEHAPTSARMNAPIAPPILVNVLDDGGYKALAADNVVNLALVDNSNGATLSGTLSSAAVNGLATFNNVRVDKAGIGYAFSANATGLAGGVSGTFHIREPFAGATAGYFHSCGLTTDGAVYCWGDVGRPTLESGAVKFASISSGRDERCGLTSTGAAYCWGRGGPPAAVPGGGTFARLSAGYAHNCALSASGAAHCWGANSFGELGNGTVGGNIVSSPIAVTGGHAFGQVSTGRQFSCGLTTAGKAYCWGDNGGGMLGTGTPGHSAIPAPVAGDLTFVSISAGGFHACALTASGAVYCWGQNSGGQLGDGTITGRGIPGLVVGGIVFAAISAGNRHNCGLTSAGVAYCWGDNADGALGSAGGSSISPVAVSGGLTFSEVRAGRFHSCASTSAGDVYCWGSNANRVLDGGDTPSGTTPVLVP